jgi:hypothetical protein
MIKTISTAAVLASLLLTQSAVAETAPEQEDALAVQSENKEVERFDINVTSNPFYLLFGGVQAAASFRLDKKFAAGPTLSTMSVLGSRFSSVGVQGQYHLRDKDVMGKGLVLDSSLEWTTYSFEAFNGESERDNGLLATTSVNWQWFYENGFNFRIGLGVAANMGGLLGDDTVVTGSSVLVDGDSFVVHAYIDAKMAWAF